MFLMVSISYKSATEKRILAFIEMQDGNFQINNISSFKSMDFYQNINRIDSELLILFLP